MRRSVPGLVLGLLALLLPVLLAGCARPAPAAQDDGDLTGTLSISGAWALYPMMVRWSEEFQKLHPGVQFDISAGGAGKGMTDVLAGAVDIGMVSREIYAEELAKGAVGFAVTKDAVFVTVNADNPVWADLHQQGLTRAILEGIYISGQITTWGQAVGRPEVQDPIHVFTRSDAAGAPATFAAYLGHAQEDLLGVGVYGDPGVLDAVIKDPLGIGYNNLNYAFDAITGLPVAGARVVPLDSDGSGQADPGEVCDAKQQAVDAVASGRYPSPPARDLYLVTNGRPAGVVRELMRWILSDGQQYVDEVGYIPLPAEQLAQELGRLE